MIVRVNVVLNRTVTLLFIVTDVSTTCAVVIFRVKVSCITSGDGIKVWSAQSLSTTVRFRTTLTRTFILNQLRENLILS